MTLHLLLVALSACGGGNKPAQEVGAPPPEAPAAAKITLSEATPHVVLVTLDTTRADRIGAYGYPRAATDTLDALAARGVRYAHASSPLPLTIPSHAAMMTGRYPARLGIRGNGAGRLADEELTLAEILSGRGWRTGASVAAFVTTRVWGFRQGFDDYMDVIPEGKENFWHGERPGNAVVDDALTWVAAQPSGQPLFLWVHLYDAHFPYVAPQQYFEAAQGRPYDAELAFVDDQVGRLVEAFAGQPTLFVIAGDHGEGLGEHGELNHGMFIYEPTQHVPLIVAGPGVAPAVVEDPVSLVDVLPIVLGRLKIPLPERLDGTAARPPGGPVYLEAWDLAQRFGLAPHVGVVSGRYKLINTPRPELYDVVADPLEAQDLSADLPGEVERLRGLMAASGFEAPSSQVASSVDPAVAAQLAQLGYVEGEMGASDGPAPDPKDHLELVRQTQQADRLVQLHQPEKALVLLQKLVADHPTIMEFRNRLAGTLDHLGRREEGKAVLEEGLRIDPDSPSLRMAHAGILGDQGRFVEASAAYEKLATESPYIPRVRGLAVSALHHAGQADRAIAMAQTWLAAWPNDRSLQGVLGAILVEQGRMDEAIPLLEAANQDDRPEVDVAFLLGTRALNAGNAEAAFVLFAKEIASYPNNLKAVYARARLALRLRRWPELVEAASLGVERHSEAELWYLLVMGRFNLGDYAAARVAVDEGLKLDPTQPDLLLMDANLLAKEGKREAAVARFAEAQAAKAARDAAAVATPKAAGAPDPAAPPPAASDLGIPMDPAWGPAR